MRLFSKLFNFPEQSYSQTQRALLEIARFQPAQLRVPATAVDSQENPLGKSGSDGPSCEKELVIPREKCEFIVNDENSDSTTTSKTISAGIFWMPSVGDLRRVVAEEAKSIETGGFGATNDTKTNTKRGQIILKNMVGEARSMHSTGIEHGGVVQTASQFNTLEFPSPSAIPENGIEGYEFDHTQGPACALACFAGTAYRNYLMPVSSFSGGNSSSGVISGRNRGQTQGNQLNGLDRVEEYLSQTFSFSSSPWKVRNGYIEVSDPTDLSKLNEAISKSATNSQMRDEILSRVCIGIHEDTEVTDTLLKQKQETAGESNHGRKFVTQTYNSAISIGYSRFSSSRWWRPMARLVLDATYEATLLVGALKTIHAMKEQQNSKKSLGETERKNAVAIKRPTIFLTKVGGGVFQNEDDWIIESISGALKRVNNLCGIGLDVRIVHFGQIDPRYMELEQ